MVCSEMFYYHLLRLFIWCYEHGSVSGQARSNRVHFGVPIQHEEYVAVRELPPSELLRPSAENFSIWNHFRILFCNVEHDVVDLRTNFAECKFFTK